MFFYSFVLYKDLHLLDITAKFISDQMVQKELYYILRDRNISMILIFSNFFRHSKGRNL